MTIADRVIKFYHELDFTGDLPKGIRIMIPFRDNPVVGKLIREFYTKFYSDSTPRQLVLGINPGRFGAGTTGIPFTDTRRLNEKCGIRFTDFRTHEPSSVFVYEMIDGFGGVREFYDRFLISAICPLGFTKTGGKGNPVNFNYFDSRDLIASVYPFIVETLKKQCAFGIDNSVCFCLGTGKNYKFLEKLNKDLQFFHRIIPLEHPRFIMQYRARQRQEYVRKYVEVLAGNW